MHSITILSVGKNKPSWLEQAWQEYCLRLKPWVAVETRWLATAQQLELLLTAHPQSLLLDPQGVQLDSLGFKEKLFNHALRQKGRVEVAIGSDLGFSQTLRTLAQEQGRLISLSRLTLTHQMCRLLLIEQIYRSLQIERGSPYHK